MAMIFTEQENIDDVIFFPMMRPSVSPLNAAIYGIAEAALAPVEDVALSWEDFQSLCNEGALQPHARRLAVHPRVRHWGAVEATGQVDIEGFLPNSVLRLAGFKVAAEGESFEVVLVQFLKNKFVDCHITVSPVTVLGVY
jgi:hypothetical protein